MSISRVVIAAALLVAACGGDGGGNVTEFDDAPSQVVVEIVAGDVTITGNANVAGASVETEVDGDVTPELELTDGVLTIGDDCTTDCRVDYSILVAEGTSVVVRTDEGNVTVNDLSGAITVDASEGAVTLATVTGDIEVVVGDGSVLGTRLEADVATFDVTEGDVDVTFDEIVNTLVVATGNGDVTVQLPDGEYAFETDPEDRTELLLEATDGAGNIVTLATGDGDIVVYRR